MRTLLLTALLLALPGAARAEQGGAPAPPSKAAPAERPKGGSASAAKAPATRADAPAKKASVNPKTADAGAGKEAAPAPEKPCEPVKPCPID